MGQETSLQPQSSLGLQGKGWHVFCREEEKQPWEGESSQAATRAPGKTEAHGSPGALQPGRAGSGCVPSAAVPRQTSCLMEPNLLTATQQLALLGLKSRIQQCQPRQDARMRLKMPTLWFILDLALKPVLLYPPA